jgi:hypothetical protein
LLFGDAFSSAGALCGAERRINKVAINATVRVIIRRFIAYLAGEDGVTNQQLMSVLRA